MPRLFTTTAAHSENRAAVPQEVLQNGSVWLRVGTSLDRASQFIVLVSQSDENGVQANWC